MFDRGIYGARDVQKQNTVLSSAGNCGVNDAYIEVIEEYAKLQIALLITDDLEKMKEMFGKY